LPSVLAGVIVVGEDAHAGDPAGAWQRFECLTYYVRIPAKVNAIPEGR